MGGLGNQMFIYAAARNYQLKHGGNLVFNIISYDTDKNGREFSLQNMYLKDSITIVKEKNKFLDLLYALSKFCPELIRKIGIHIGYFVWDGKLYAKLPGMKQKRQYLKGYFQCERYFEEHKDIIKKELRVLDQYLDKNMDIYREISNSNSVCVHIRRGDYIKVGLLICDINYYLEGIAYMEEHVSNPRFYIFSDDIDWVAEHIKPSENISYIKGVENDFEELQLMYSCKHFIISNSSFSWWAQYLAENPDKIVIAPKKWSPKEDITRSIYQDNWVLLDTYVRD